MSFEWNSDNDSTNNDHLTDLWFSIWQCFNVLVYQAERERAEIDAFARNSHTAKCKAKELEWKKQRRGEKMELSGSSNSAIQIILAVFEFVNKKYAFAWINLGCLPFAEVHRPVATVAVLRLVQSVVRCSPTRRKP